MSTIAIVVIVVVVVLVLAGLFFLLPRVRGQARAKKRERELGQRRQQVIGEHRGEAEKRKRQAEEAERRARIAEQEARRERAEAQLREEKAALHESGMADHELVGEHEREEFADTSAVPGSTADGKERERTSAYDEGRRAARDPSRVEDFQAGEKRERG